MIIRPSTPGGYVVFCDDIRHELSGKVTLVGTYNGELQLLGEAPLVIPKLCLEVHYIDDPETFPKKIAICVEHVIADEKTELAREDLEISGEAAKAGVPAVKESSSNDSKIVVELINWFELNNLVVEQDSKIRVRAYVGDDEVRLGTLYLRLISA